MEKYRRLILIATTGAFLAATPSLFATGGDSFDEPAPALGDALDFLPGKSLGEIFLETDAHPSDKEEPDFDEEILKLAERLRSEPSVPLVAAVDRLLAQARQHYSKGGESCNLLHDVRDVISGSAQDKVAAADYLKWRVEDKKDVDLEKKAQEVSGPLKAHWLYQVGADTFRAGDRERCRPWFERVVKEFPTHPRAEIALFMQARCAFSESRRGIDAMDDVSEDKTRERGPARKKAAEMFERYRKQYPRGRFEADALGWLGALAFDSDDYLKALEYYIAQAETPGHPETIKSAVFMCEKCLVRVAEKPESTAAFALIARHPRIAMGFTYLVLSAPEAKNYDGEVDKPADVKKWRRTILPRIAAEVVKQKQIYQSGDWKPRYLAMLAQAASATGNQEQALQLTNLSPAELERSDDLLMVRALAFQRASKATDAIEAYRKLLSTFPESPLAAGARLRLALALQDDHQAGAAVVELRRLLTKPTEQESKDEEEPKDKGENADSDDSFQYPTNRYTSAENYPDGEEEWDIKTSSVYPNLSGADVEQIQQAIDTLLNFAPLTELATALEEPGFNEENKKELRAIIAQRYLAQEKFTEAKKFMAPDEFNRLAARLESLTLAAAGPPQEKAEEMLRLGDAWAEARGTLLRAPLDRRVHLLKRAGGTLDPMARRANGRSIQLKNIDAELSERDELRHASRWWLSAARARPGTPLGAKARWKALEAMPQIAAASEYAEQLAREIKGEAVSKEIYNRLRAEAPDSVEAKRLAAYWSFPPASEETQSEEDQPSRKDAYILGYPVIDFGAFSLPESAAQDYAVRSDILKRVASLPMKASIATPEAMATEVRELDTWFRKNLADIDDAITVNFLDDLAQFFAERNITQEMQRVYVGLRFDVLESNGFERLNAADDSTRKKDSDIAAEIDAALKDPAMQPVADYLEFSLIGLKAGDRTKVETDIADEKEDNGKAVYTSRDHAGMEKMARDLLKKYPQTHKKEAALFVIARSVQALSRPYLVDVGVPRPGSVGNEDIEVVQKSSQREPFDPKRVLGALDEYDREFPNGRYAADVRNLRAMTLWRMHDWPQALDLTLAQLADKSKPDLQPEAGLRLANIFAELAQAEQRADILDAIRTRPAAMAQLKVFLVKAPTSRSHPLRYLVSFLGEQLKLNAVASN